MLGGGVSLGWALGPGLGSADGSTLAADVGSADGSGLAPWVGSAEGSRLAGVSLGEALGSAADVGDTMSSEATRNRVCTATTMGNGVRRAPVVELNIGLPFGRSIRPAVP
jgi:hypothetical protein